MNPFLLSTSPISAGTLIHNDHSNNAPESSSQQHSHQKQEGAHDCSSSSSSSSEVIGETVAVSRGGVVTPFPWKLHDMLERVHVDGFDDIVTWQPHGRSFMVHKPDEFVEQVMPIYFNQTKFASFQRQLNLYGFRRITHGKDKGAYYHVCFLRGRRNLCQGMHRQKVKGTRVRRSMIPCKEPDFWSMPFLEEQQKQQQQQQPSDTQTPASVVSSPSSSEPSSPALTCVSSSDESLTDDFLTDAILSSDVLFFEGKPFYYLDKQMVADPEKQPPSIMDRQRKTC